jgi:PIN domain nuclease of toxin-antitoxin system
MRLLLDLPIFLWYINRDPRLPNHLLDAIQNQADEVYLSVAAVWEAIIKNRLGKLPLPEAPETYLPGARERHGIQSLPIDEATTACLAALPPIHRDPFERIMIAQSNQHDLTIVSVDDVFRHYPVQHLGK